MEPPRQYSNFSDAYSRDTMIEDIRRTLYQNQIYTHDGSLKLLIISAGTFIINLASRTRENNTPLSSICRHVYYCYDQRLF